MSNKVVIGMSGGVDSSVGAYLLKKSGYDVTGVTMQIWQDEDRCTIEKRGGCCGLSAVDDARKVCVDLNIPFFVLNFKSVFKEKVIDYFVDEYYLGRTPNPCIACNRFVKWEALLDKALIMEADFIATGHYADIVQLENGRYSIRRDENNPKDQTYALYNLSQKQLKHTLMPLKGYTKDTVRKIAKDIGLQVFNKPDSQEICFIPDNNYAGFLEKEGVKNILPGNFVDVEGNILGRHKGIIYYTVGQRKGLGITFGKPMFVKQINPDTNEIILGDNEEIFSAGLIASDLNFMSVEGIKAPIEVMAKIRYSHKPAKAVIAQSDDGRLICTFEQPQRAVTPGQSAVFYDKEGNIVCGGAIDSTSF